MLYLLPGDLCEAFARDTARNARSLCIALAHVHSVRIIALSQAAFNKLLHFKTGRVVKAFEFLLDVCTHCSMEGLGGLFEEYFALERYKFARKSVVSAGLT